jgi:nicotinamidase-related amidase
MVIDMQQRLVPAIHQHARVVARVLQLVQAARLLHIPVLGTEQYPQGLGSTLDELKPLFLQTWSKTSFHAALEPGPLDLLLADRRIEHVTLAGIEAHVCVAQTAIQLRHAGFLVQVAADAVGSRDPFDRDVALRRLEAGGVTISTAEAILFEWIETADHPQFKALSGLVKSFAASASAAESGPARALLQLDSPRSS